MKRSSTLSTITSLTTVVALCALSIVATAQSAAAATNTVAVDMSTNLGTPNTAMTGFLYGLTPDGSGPSDSVLDPLKPTLARGGGAASDAIGGWACGGLTGYENRFDYVKGQYDRLAPLGATYEVLISDLWGADGSLGAGPTSACPTGAANTNGSWPGDPTDGNPTDWNWTDYNIFLGDLVDDLSSNNITHIRYDIWNEPDGKSWGAAGGAAQYDAMWEHTVAYLHTNAPGVDIVGPSYSHFDSTLMTSWLTTMKAADALPDILNWHFSTNPATDATTVRSTMSSLSIPALPLEMNEYIYAPTPSPDFPQKTAETVGPQTNYIAGLIQGGYLDAEHAVWRSSGVGSLDSIVTSSGQPTAMWWGYERYAEMSGTSVQVTPGTAINGIASQDSTKKVAQILLGGDSSFTGSATVNISGLGSTSYLESGGQVHAILQQIPSTDYSTTLAAPITISAQNYAVSSGSISLTIPWSGADDAWEIILTPPTDDSALNLGLDQITGTTAYDSSANGNNGAASNVTWANDSAQFNGTSSTINLGNPSSLNFSGAITMSAWIDPTSTTGNQAILYHLQTSGQYDQDILRLQSGNLVGGSYTLSGGTHFASAPFPSADIGHWTYVTATNDGTQWTIYINGVPQSSLANTTGALTTTGNWAVGSSGNGDQYFSGAVAAATIYNRALTTGEMQADMGQRAAALWPAQEGSGTAIHDTSVNASNGTAAGTSWTTSPAGHALSFAGAGNVGFGAPASLNFTGPITLSTWVKPTSSSGNQAILYHLQNSDTYPQTFLRIESGIIQGGSYSTAIGTRTVTYPIAVGQLGTWLHLTVTWDGVNWSLYEGSTLEASYANGNGALASTGSWSIGSSGAGDQYLNASVYDSRVYPYAMTANEIAAISH